MRSVKKSTYSFLLIVTVLFSGSHTAKGTVHFHVCTALLRSRVVYLSSLFIYESRSDFSAFDWPSSLDDSMQSIFLTCFRTNLASMMPGRFLTRIPTPSQTLCFHRTASNSLWPVKLHRLGQEKGLGPKSYNIYTGNLSARYKLCLPCLFLM